MYQTKLLEYQVHYQNINLVMISFACPVGVVNLRALPEAASAAQGKLAAVSIEAGVCEGIRNSAELCVVFGGNLAYTTQTDQSFQTSTATYDRDNINIICIL